MKIADIVEPILYKIVSEHDELRYVRQSQICFEIWLGPEDIMLGFIGCISNQVRYRGVSQTGPASLKWSPMEVMSADKDIDLGNPDLDLYEELSNCIMRTWEELIKSYD